MQGIGNSWSKLVIKRYWKDSWTAIGQRFTTFPQISRDNILFLVTPKLWAWRIRHGIAEKIRRKLIGNFWKIDKFISIDLHLGKFGEWSRCATVELFPKFAKVQISIQFSTWSRETYLGGEEPKARRRCRQNSYVFRGGKMGRIFVAHRWRRAVVGEFAACCRSGSRFWHSWCLVCSGVVGSWVRGWWEKLEWDFRLVLPVGITNELSNRISYDVCTFDDVSYVVGCVLVATPPVRVSLTQNIKMMKVHHVWLCGTAQSFRLPPWTM